LELTFKDLYIRIAKRLFLDIRKEETMPLESFRPKEEDSVRVSEDSLRKTVVAIFEKLGLPQEDCFLAADGLISADLRGVESHGVSNLLRNWVHLIQEGTINPKPNWKIIRESPSVTAIDCDRGLGMVLAPKAMEIAVKKARDTGTGMVTMKNGRHLGMAAYTAMIALKYDMIGMCLTVAGPKMVPTFGAEPRLGTNPISLAAPAGKEAPFVFDASTTVAASNTIDDAVRLNIPLPAGWVPDKDGTPIMREVEPEYFGKGKKYLPILPLGSTREMGSHKGYGLSACVDIMSGILTGGGYGANPGRPNYNHSVAAYNIASFMDVAEFKRTMDDYLQYLKSTKPAPGHDRVYYAGLIEAEYEAECKVKGIPLHKEVIGWFDTICKELSIPCLV
jgi:L-2-hydroxycarboxylate dehydrogenase (NAD+)